MPHRHLLVVDAAVPVLVAVVVGVATALHGGGSSRPWALTLGIVAAVSLAGRRRWPGGTLALSGGLVVVLFHVDRGASAVAVLAPAVALYSLALRRGRVQQVGAGVVAVLAVVLADVLQPGRPTVAQTLGHVLLVAIPLLAAEVIRTHQANVKLLVEQLELANHAREQEARRRAEEERIRIARDLHDVVAHTLTEINVTAAAAAENSEPSPARTALEGIEAASHAAIGELRSVLGVLRDPTSEAPRSPAPGIDDLPSLVERARSSGMNVHLNCEGTASARLSEAAALAAYRIVQEALTNARRHAPGGEVRVTVRYGASHLDVTVDSDPGQPAEQSAVPGVGIQGMRERAAAVGGRLDAGPRDPGFGVHATLPYGPAP